MAKVQSTNHDDDEQQINGIHTIENHSQSLVDISFKNLSYKVEVPNSEPEGKIFISCY
jgi:hypothetical protein